ncbi:MULTISPECIES: 4Fe-4S dicluster domain-containing protein [unclassified Carboxydocella]|uniref:4Fe-4S dicluster domain-containing protein n=1 Tax=unclassified Carboxydocella TaxID=2685367 RepID=UPI0009AD9FB4|nr:MULTISPECIES: 4Fe-4S dicluster domain-containing protein [unclassified Carboxydocella]GAW29134.1 iron-sulfur protein [Carboxydocella sp. ULO1]GAW32011.1 iron-sulfur protein [Carboxydocella sp. JDF658]
MARAKENFFIYADPQKCLGCKNCEIACAVAHAGCDLQTAVTQGLQLQPRNSVVQVEDMVMPIQCRQCEDAPCAHACPTGAIYEEDRFVKINESNCIGCKVCTMVCPFGAIIVAKDITDEGTHRTQKGKARKCDLCFSRTQDSDEFTCACVEACPTKAIMLVDYESYRKKLIEDRGKELVRAHAHSKNHGLMRK